MKPATQLTLPQLSQSSSRSVISSSLLPTSLPVFTQKRPQNRYDQREVRFKCPSLIRSSYFNVSTSSSTIPLIQQESNQRIEYLQELYRVEGSLVSAQDYNPSEGTCLRDQRMPIDSSDQSGRRQSEDKARPTLRYSLARESNNSRMNQQDSSIICQLCQKSLPKSRISGKVACQNCGTEVCSLDGEDWSIMHYTCGGKGFFGTLYELLTQRLCEQNNLDEKNELIENRKLIE